MIVNVFRNPKMLQNIAILLILLFIAFIQLGCTMLEVQVHTSQRVISLKGDNDKSTLVRGNDEQLKEDKNSIHLTE